MTNGDSFEVMLGSNLTFECQVRGGGESTQLTWYFNDDPLPDIEVHPRQDLNGRTYLVSQLSFEGVKISHEGGYACRVHSPLHNLTVSAPIQLTVASELTQLTSCILKGGILSCPTKYFNYDCHKAGTVHHFFSFPYNMTISQ